MENAEDQGRLAYSDGKAMSDNPHKVASPLYAKWLKGWRDAVNGDPFSTDEEKAAMLGDD
jgi:ribosome modulation factor